MAGFLPFSFQNAEDRIRVFSLLHVMHMGDYPLPRVLGQLMLMIDDEDLRRYVEEIQAHCGVNGRRVGPLLRWQAVEALDALAYFHGRTCEARDGKCLGGEIDEIIAQFTS